VRARRLFEEFTLCYADGSFRKRLAAIAKISVLIIDDFAIAPIGPRERNDLLELLGDRVGSRACIVTRELPVNDWHDYIGDPTLADGSAHPPGASDPSGGEGIDARAGSCQAPRAPETRGTVIDHASVGPSARRFCR
jgi:hypothetical protein